MAFNQRSRNVEDFDVAINTVRANADLYPIRLIWKIDFIHTAITPENTNAATV